MTRRALFVAALLVIASGLVHDPVARGQSGREPGPSALPEGVSVAWITVSPHFEETGFVAVIGSGCEGNCIWVSRDGGASWRRAQAEGWHGGRIFAAGTNDGETVLFAESGEHAQRSDDGGESWSDVGGPGKPTPAPTFAEDGAVGVASKDGNYVVRGGDTEVVAGSGEGFVDLSFGFAPNYPRSGTHAPVLSASVDTDASLMVINRCTAALECERGGALGPAGDFAAPGMEVFPAPEYDKSGVVFARSGRGVYKSIDGARTFVELGIGQQGASATATGMMAIDPRYEERGQIQRAYVAVLQIWVDQTEPENSHSAGGIYRTDDGGATWKRMGTSTPLEDGATAVALAPGGRLFAGYASSQHGAGLLCSDDAGKTWSANCSPVGAEDPPDAGSSGSGTRGGSEPVEGRAPAAGGDIATDSTAIASERDGDSGGDGAAAGSARSSSTRPGNGGGLPPLLLAVAVAVLGAALAVALRLRRRWSAT